MYIQKKDEIFISDQDISERGQLLLYPTNEIHIDDKVYKIVSGTCSGYKCILKGEKVT